MPCFLCNDLIYEESDSGKDQRSRTINSRALFSSALNGCPSCKFISDGVRVVLGSDSFERVEVEQYTAQKHGEERHTYPLVVRATLGPENIVYLDFYTDNPQVHEKWPLIPVSPHRSADSSSETCLLQAKAWLKHCLESHAECAPHVNVGPSQTKLPSRVIAVGNEQQQPCLHETSEDEYGMYAALSYCWGTTRTFTTTQSTLEARKRGFDLSDLPYTCRDALIVARTLGISYIWIDSLCIIQDSRQDWEREAAMMGSVYTNAVVTLAGLDSPDSDTGLFIADSTRRTYYLPCPLSNGGLGYVYSRRRHRKLLMGFLHADRGPPAGDDFGGILQTRGWTLQELTLSPRILWFSAWEAGWSCRSTTACECDPIPTAQLMKGSAERLTTLPQAGESQAWLGIWRDFIKVFTRRKLTHQSDRLPALTGIATAMSESIGGRYFAGLWEDQLEKNLLWTTNWFVLPTGEEAPQRLPVGDEYAPSWSWASVSGPIWFMHFTDRPIYQSFWRIRDVEFTASTSNRFGPGQGTILLDALMLPLNISDDGYFVCPVGEEYVYFSDTADCWFPDRVDPHDMQRLAEMECFFIFAGAQRKRSDREKEEFTKFGGLVIERTKSDVYRRVGLIDAEFNSESCDGSWSDWKSRGREQQIRLV